MTNIGGKKANILNAFNFSSVSELSNPINLFRISELMGFNNINAIVRVRVTNPTIKDMLLM